MKRIDTINARENMFGIGKSGFHDNADLSGQDATYVSPEWFNTVQEELCNLLELRGITLDPASKRQLYDLLTTQADLEALADEIESNFIRKSQIIDNLTTNDANKPVSAKQAKILQDQKLGKNDNAVSATKLKDPVKINGIEFDGSDDITIPTQSITVLTGTIAHEGTIPLPDGYVEEQCHWMVSISVAETNGHAGNNQGSDFWYQECFTTGRIVTAKVRMVNTSVNRPAWKAATANYIVVGIK